jgi:hypothetical protein
MDKFHINAEGNPGKCTAKVKCPFGGDDAHYFSKEAAQKAFEDATKSEALKVWKKKTIVAPEAAETPATAIGHGGFHGRAASTPVASPATGYGFHGATMPPAPKAAPARRPSDDLGHGRRSYGHGNW